MFYFFQASVLARWLVRLYGFGRDRTTWALMTAVAFLLASAAGVLAGEIWAGVLEAFRIGNGHMSYRAARIPWAHHRLELFGAGVVLFWLAAAVWQIRDRALAMPNRSCSWLEEDPGSPQPKRIR